MNNPTMIPPMPWDVNQVQQGPCYGWGGNRFNNQNWNFFNNQGYDPNGQSFGPNQNGYQGAGTVPESLQTGQLGSFTKDTWNMSNRYILVETPNMPRGMGRRPVRCFRCRQFGHYTSECPNQSYTEDYGPICRNCKQSGHTTDQCNAPFNFNNRN